MRLSTRVNADVPLLRARTTQDRSALENRGWPGLLADLDG